MDPVTATSMPDAVETLGQVFLASVAREKRDYLLVRNGDQYQPLDSGEFFRRVVRLQLSLRNLGLSRGDRCALLSENRWEWAAADFAMVTAGIVSVPLYPTLPAEHIHYLLENSEARAVFVSTELQREKIEAIWEKLPALEHVIQFDDQPGAARRRMESLAAMISSGPLADAERKQFQKALDAVGAEELASIIYTSGTTGTPKGVMLTHRNLVSNILDTEAGLGPSDVALSFLPLCHIYQRLADYICYFLGVTVAHVGGLADVPAALEKVKPTVLTAVPRFYEKLYSRVMEAVEAAPPSRRKLFQWAVGVGSRCTPYRLANQPLPMRLRFQFALANLLVFSKIRNRMGGRVQRLSSGGAALDRKLAELFCAVNLPIMEGYGLTETSPVVATNRPGALRLGTVGRPIRNVEVRIAADGEILVRGPNVMRGYYKMKAETAEALAGGWFHTGDIGSLDEDGFLSVLDRKKDLLKTSGGKYIAPQPIENRLKNESFIADAVIIADRRRFPCALIVPNFERLEQFARDRGISAASRAELVRMPEVVALIDEHVARACASFAPFEQVKKVALLDREFSLADGEITPTMKVRRREVESRYRELIEKIYEEATAT